MTDRASSVCPERARRVRRRALSVLVALSALVAAGPVSALDSVEPSTPASTGPRDEPIKPVPHPRGNDARKVELGRLLFHDKRLSADGSVACASCHPLEQGGMDNRRRSIGVQGVLGVINTPTVFNATLHFALFWDARARNTREQVGQPITDPREMATTWSDLLSKVRANPTYRARFDDIYEGVDEKGVRDALGAFVDTLLTPNAPFDRWLRGDGAALSREALEGYRRFKSMGCVACHHGVAVGGNMVQRFGIMGDYFADRGSIETADLGRFNVTRREADRHRFKVPSLRNIALTAPYFHDGSAATLAEAVRVMAYYQLGRHASEDDVRLIVAFLESLTGSWQGSPLGSPIEER